TRDHRRGHDGSPTAASNSIEKPCHQTQRGPGRAERQPRATLEGHAAYDAQSSDDEITPHEGPDGMGGHVREHRRAYNATHYARRKKGQEDLPVEIAEPGMRSARDPGGDDFRRVYGCAGDERRDAERRENGACGNAVAHTDAAIDHLCCEAHGDQPEKLL